MTAGYYDPSYGMTEWCAFLDCVECDGEREHDFAKQHGVTTAICTTCGLATEIDPRDFED